MSGAKLFALLALAAAVAGGVAAGAAAPARPDLVARGVTVGDGGVTAGAVVQPGARIRNAGRAGAARSRAGFFLSLDRRRGGSDLRLGARAVPALGPGEAVRRSPRLRIPTSTTPGSYHLLVCADARRRVAETRERNNCGSAVIVVEGGSGGGGGGEGNPPSFDGLQSATTCIPGPAGGDRRSRYTLGWAAASDDATPPGQIVYDVYQATSAGGQDFSGPPTYTSEPGATSFRTPELSSQSTWYFVVRARDGDGKRDGNRVEKQGENLCL